MSSRPAPLRAPGWRPAWDTGHQEVRRAVPPIGRGPGRLLSDVLDIPRRCGFDCCGRDWAFHGEGGPVAERVRVREITDQEGQRLLRILRRSTGSVVTWRRAQMVLLSAQGMPAPAIAQVTFTSCDRVRDVLHSFNADGFDALYPRHRGGRPTTFTLPQRRRIKTLALSRPADHDLPFATWSLAKLADFLVAEGWSTTSATRACGSCSTKRASRFK
jgi:transposase